MAYDRDVIVALIPSGTSISDGPPNLQSIIISAHRARRTAKSARSAVGFLALGCAVGGTHP